MANVLAILADGFEDIEAFATIDLLKRAGISVDIATIKHATALSSKGIEVKVPKQLNFIHPEEYDALFLPGGPGVENLDNSNLVREIIQSFDDRKAIIAAICAAPLILGKMNLLKDRQYTCYPSFERFGENGHYKVVPVVKDGHIITGRGVAYVFDFASTLIETLVGKETLDKVLEATLISE
jgi:4-methyl-5(b-hydroxyethyl)-thiazole monophosphate biosynthesis